MSELTEAEIDRALEGKEDLSHELATLSPPVERHLVQVADVVDKILGEGRR